jgi:hypothetical protein
LLKRLFREPLVQFLALGGVLFAAYALLAPAEETSPERIVIDHPVIDSLEAAFQATWKRPPTDSELQGLIDNHIAEEVLYREAQKLSLDQDDVVIRRRMRQKMEFLLQGSLARAPPDEAMLRAFYEAEQERYKEPDRRTFRQLYLGPHNGADGVARWEALAERLNGANPPDPEEVSQPSLLPPRMELAHSDAIDRVFGKGFADTIQARESRRWSGPVASSYGWHLVWVESVERGGPRAFEAVRAQVERDFAYQRKQEAEAALINRLKQQYEIVIEEATP